MSIGQSILITQPSDLTPFLAAPQSLSSLTSSGHTAVATAASPHNVPVGDTFNTTISGATPTGYNGSVIATATGTSTFTYTVGTLSSPAGGSPLYTLFNQNELINRVGSFFAQGSLQSVYVTELGSGTPAAGVIALATLIASPQIINGKPLQIYIWGLPSTWTTESTAPTFAAANNTAGSLVYFIVPMPIASIGPWVLNPPLKSVLAISQSANAPITESDVGAVLFQMLNQSPSATTKMTPLAYRYMLACTPFGPTPTQASAMQAANVNYIDTGAEGGISNAILKLGRMLDGNDFSYWYGNDWTNLNLHQTIANTIINGNNNPINPVVYNQQGINTLQAAAQGVINNGITFGVINNATPVAAVPFVTYTTQNPSHYAQGIYNGLSDTIVTQIGFITVTFNLQLSNFGVAGHIPTS